MINGKSILALIPARASSKGLPGKNIKMIAGKPLIAWTIEQALECKCIDKAVVSTDGREIFKIARNYGAEVPFMRPAELAADGSPTADTVTHALDFFESQQETYDYLALLEPTSPLRKPGDLDRGIEMLVTHPAAQALVSVGEVHLEHPLIVKKIVGDYLHPYIAGRKKIHQRQQVDKALFPYGVLYLVEVTSFKRYRTFYPEYTIPMEIERWQNYEIDNDIDFFIIEQLLMKYLK